MPLPPVADAALTARREFVRKMLSFFLNTGEIAGILGLPQQFVIADRDFLLETGVLTLEMIEATERRRTNTYIRAALGILPETALDLQHRIADTLDRHQPLALQAKRRRFLAARTTYTVMESEMREELGIQDERTEDPDTEPDNADFPVLSQHLFDTARRFPLKSLGTSDHAVAWLTSQGFQSIGQVCEETEAELNARGIPAAILAEIIVALFGYSLTLGMPPMARSSNE